MGGFARRSGFQRRKRAAARWRYARAEQGITRWVTISGPNMAQIWLGPRRPTWSALHGWAGSGGCIPIPLDQLRLMGVQTDYDQLCDNPHRIRFGAAVLDARGPGAVKKEGPQC